MTEREIAIKNGFDIDKIRCVVFDAMGVLYQDGDDVAAILMPLLKKYDRFPTLEEVSALYAQAKVGAITSRQFWEGLGLPEMTDEEYCANYTLSPGTHQVIKQIAKEGLSLAVLSNDISEWSKVLRHQFGLDQLIPTWVISGDIKTAKPEEEAFTILLERVKFPASEVVFIDDNVANLRVASRLGINVIQFKNQYSDGLPLTQKAPWPQVASMDELATLFSELHT